MILSNKLLLSDFVRKHSQAVKPLNAWVEKVAEAVWQSHNDVKATFPSADYVKNGRYVFNIHRWSNGTKVCRYSRGI